jgi:O-antigen/teichoic acid export membrane protein
VVTSRLAQDSAVALAFGQAAVVARIPLLLFSPVQTMLLPGLTAAVTRGELRTVARRVALTLAAIAVSGTLAVVVFVLLGPWVLRTFLHTTTDLGAVILLLLATSTVVVIAAYAVQPALVALGRDRVVTAGWALGTAVTLTLALLPGDAVSLGAFGQLAGPALTLVVVLLGLRAGLRAPAQGMPEPVAATASAPGATPDR